MTRRGEKNIFLFNNDRNMERLGAEDVVGVYIYCCRVSRECLVV